MDESITAAPLNIMEKDPAVTFFHVVKAHLRITSIGKCPVDMVTIKIESTAQAKHDINRPHPSSF